MLSRRNFLKTAAAVSAPLFIPASAFGANETVKIAVIGLGGRARFLAKEAIGAKDVRIVAVCDCFKPRIDEFISKVQPEGQKWNQYTDFREMIEKEKPDGVMVETTTHARAWVACNAMAAGVDTYIEKPMCLTIAEGREMVNCARKYKRVTQVGTQQRSIALNNWASDLVKNGKIGKVKAVLAPNFIAPYRWEDKPGAPMPPGGDDKWWDIWTNQAVFRPYHPDLHQGWAKWWDYDGGGVSFGVTGWGAHSYDQIQRGLGTDETGPIEVLLEEPVKDGPVGKFDHEPGPDETGASYYNMIKKTVGPRAKVKMKYANGAELQLHLDGDNSPGLGCRFVGEKGWIEINRDMISANPKELITGADRPEPQKTPEDQRHIENFAECIKSRKKCNADIEYGTRSSSVCYLVNIVREVGKIGEPLKWDPDKEKFTNSDDANKLLTRPRRKGYELPA